ncbi:hypothetical protein HNO92_002425 [Chromobacterium alkanivorans]|uniref:hypothetical protein n=1 Tax=Chromobacterium alkanivorans TaxID=1071719 RepID=UPI001968A2C4|nr:hypothetical protein [Chromobacterium alkanivorans]MBN3004058.1 hypothetical protein [Chromobacterium alkanivorans]MCS3805580.1 hypothetical protein [Chromobacterium alkanivorans]MCS3819919.1 hypothetical protein [Chromobacterium alkanivorans]MCS3874106.1 hypothetical protein [Chromobacterium alkanivorans]
MKAMMLCAAAALAAIPAAASAYSDEARLPFAGQPGELPLEVVLRFAKNRLGEDGQFEYRSLKVIQISSPEAFDKASIALLREGLMDDSVKGTRQRFQLSREDNVWTLRAVKEDFSCWRGRKGWGVKPCP